MPFRRIEGSAVHRQVYVGTMAGELVPRSVETERPVCADLGDGIEVEGLDEDLFPRKASCSALTERQITVYYGILTLGQAQGHFVLSDPARMISATFVAMEDGYQMEVLAG